MYDELAHEHADDDAQQPDGHFERAPAVWRVTRTHERENVPDNGNGALFDAVSNRILGVNEKIAERNEVGDHQA